MRPSAARILLDGCSRCGTTLSAPVRNCIRSLVQRICIHPLAWIDRRVVLGKGCVVGKCHIATCGGKGSVLVGERTILYNEVELFAHKHTVIRIGAHCMISRQSAILTADHTFRDSSRLIIDQETIDKSVTIGDDVWLGYRAIVLKGVTIGNGAVIGAGAVVTRDIPPGAVAVGVPARVQSYRDSKKIPPAHR